MRNTKKLISVLLVMLLLVATFSVAFTVHAADQGLASQYKTNPNGPGVQKTISVDGDIGDWDSSMIIAQGAANDDPRVYRDNSMYEVPIDLYTLYGAYDSKNIYLMWEMTNVQDVVAPNDNYPLSQGILYQTMNVPFFIAIDTGKSDAIGNSGKLTTGGTLWDTGITIENSFNRMIAISTNGANGPFIYSGNASGLNPKEIATSATAGISFKYGLGIKSSSVNGINGAYGKNNSRVIGDMQDDSAAWVDFNSKGHKSSTMDFHYEMSIPLDKLGVTASDVSSSGLGVMLIATMGKSGMDCLPYDLSMNDNADQPDTESQEFNSFEKSDPDNLTADFARIGKGGSYVPPVTQAPTQAPTQTPTQAPTQPTTQGGGSVSDKTVVTATSNILDGSTITATGSTVTVTYNLQSGMDLVNGQWSLSYDTSKLRLKTDKSALMPNISGTTNVYNNVVYGTFSDVDSLYNFKSSKPFVQAEFEVIGKGNASVNLNVEELSVGYKSGGVLNFENAVSGGVKQTITASGFSANNISGAAAVVNGTPSVDDKLTVNATSNFFPAASKTITKTGTQVTVEYLFKSNIDLLNSEWTLTYDTSKLSYNSTATGKIMPYANGATAKESTKGKIKGANSSTTPSSFAAEKAFVRVTFDTLATGTASVNLNVDILGLINANEDHGYLVDSGSVKNLKNQSGFTNLSYTTNTKFGSGQATPAITVKATSNIFPSAERLLSTDSSTVTVAYKLGSYYNLINAQWELTYDSSKLRFNQANLNKLQPNLSGTKAQENSVGTIKGNFTNTNTVNFRAEKDFVIVTFDVIGTGETTVNLNLIILGVVNDNDVTGYAVDAAKDQQLNKKSGFSKFYYTPVTMIIPNGEADRVKGDVNFDGKLDITDATLIQRYNAEFVLFNDDQMDVGEFNGDGMVDVSDVTAIQRHLAD